MKASCLLYVFDNSATRDLEQFCAVILEPYFVGYSFTYWFIHTFIYSFIFQAAAHGLSECVSVLLECGADVNAKDNFDMTPLQQAEKKGHDQIVALMKENTHEGKGDQKQNDQINA